MRHNVLVSRYPKEEDSEEAEEEAEIEK